VGAVGDECNESRGVCRGGDDGARHPGPSAVERDPPTVVEWSPAPRLVVDPRPAVGRIKGPPSRTVRSPIRCDVLGYPRMSVFGGVLPRAELVEILGAGDIGGNILRTERRLGLAGSREGLARRSDWRRFR